MVLSATARIIWPGLADTDGIHERAAASSTKIKIDGNGLGAGERGQGKAGDARKTAIPMTQWSNYW